jgi:hypothetical protein
MRIRHVFLLAALFTLLGAGRTVFAQHSQMGYGSALDYSSAYTGPLGPTAFSTTVEGSARAGIADEIQALGQYNYNTSLARQQNEEARRRGMDNSLYAEHIYFEMRKLNQEYWLAQNPRSTPEQIKRINQSRLPRRLSPSELDPAWGTIYWPAILQHPEFDQDRTTLNDIFAHRRDEQFGLGTPVYHQVQQLTTDMRNVLNKEYATMSQMEWIQAVRFVESLGYEARFPSSDTTDTQAVAMNR